MGLDMYLTRKYYIAGEYEHVNARGSVDITVGSGKNKKTFQLDAKQVNSIVSSVGYWRKANAIHAWFVKNVQSGEDDCREYEVSYEQLKELSDLCKMALEVKDSSLLPPQEGFFFGSTEVDEYYYTQLQETIKIIENLEEDGDYYYQSSW